MIGWLMRVEQWVEWEMAGETKTLGENPPQFHLVHNNFYMSWY
jgi:hypothetical protein